MKGPPEFVIKRAYDPPGDEDGTRILVDRLWPRGIARERLAAIWLKDLAPSTALREWLHEDPTRWDHFVHRYRSELDANPGALAELRPYLDRGRITLVYGARNTAQNHAIVLRDYLLEKDWSGAR
jgi:uncharacterized protein YeaO (DUF488 family)